uniref:Uncharacterized protein n=1 Tax=Anguilla anguilla TaxID=7936 RepID=A0A0E9STM7_ANGAN
MTGVCASFSTGKTTDCNLYANFANNPN